MYTNSTNILNQIKTQITTATASILPDADITNDEPIELIYDSLPQICIYPLKEELLYDESFSQDKKSLSIRIEVRQKGSPASSVSTPVVNAICDNLKGSKLAGLVDYIELQTIQWANDRTTEGNVCGSSIDIIINYLI